jgi:hypothetical protein
MNIYIGKDFEGKPISVLLADSREKADIAWAGMQDTPHSVEEIDPTDDSVGVHGVVFLLTSIKRNSNQSSRVGGIDYRQWKRGL